MSAMKLDFPWQDDRRHDYCLYCHAEPAEKISADGTDLFHCHACGRTAERRVVIDPGMTWWRGDDDEYWHESAGVFVRNGAGKFLFFERAIFPVSKLTVPSGHVDAGETPERAASRELVEETSWQAPQVEHVASADIVGDSCRRGSDAHRWHAYRAEFDAADSGIQLSGEGRLPRWLTLAEASAAELIYPVRYMIDRHAADLTRG